MSALRIHWLLVGCRIVDQAGSCWEAATARSNRILGFATVKSSRSLSFTTARGSRSLSFATAMSNRRLGIAAGSNLDTAKRGQLISSLLAQIASSVLDWMNYSSRCCGSEWLQTDLLDFTRHRSPTAELSDFDNSAANSRKTDYYSRLACMKY